MALIRYKLSVLVFFVLNSSIVLRLLFLRSNDVAGRFCSRKFMK